MDFLLNLSKNVSIIGVRGPVFFSKMNRFDTMVYGLVKSCIYLSSSIHLTLITLFILRKYVCIDFIHVNILFYIEFADAQMTMREIKSDLVTSRVPFRDYQTYVLYQLFPNQDIETNPLLHDSKVLFVY